jgi:hypothetical protein
MNDKYQRDATLNPEMPIHALVTNFNFHSLSRWMDKHSRDLKDKLDAPRVLCISSVLLASVQRQTSQHRKICQKIRRSLLMPRQRHIGTM